MQGLLNGQDLHGGLISLFHEGDLLAYLGQDVGQHKIPAGTCLLCADLVGAALVHTVVDHATVKAGPGQVGPKPGMSRKVGGDGGGDALLLAVVVPGHGLASGQVVGVVVLAQVHLVVQLLQDIIEIKQTLGGGGGDELTWFLFVVASPYI